MVYRKPDKHGRMFFDKRKDPSEKFNRALKRAIFNGPTKKELKQREAQARREEKEKERQRKLAEAEAQRIQKILDQKNFVLDYFFNKINSMIDTKNLIWSKIYEDVNLYPIDQEKSLIGLDDQVKFGKLNYLKGGFDKFCTKYAEKISENPIIDDFGQFWQLIFNDIKNANKKPTQFIHWEIDINDKYKKRYPLKFINNYDPSDFKISEKKIFGEKNPNLIRAIFSSKPKTDFLKDYDQLIQNYITVFNRWFFKNIKEEIKNDNKIKNHKDFVEIYRLVFEDKF